MKIAVIAANGRTGQAFVEFALAAGHTIRAGVRKPGLLSPQPHLTIVPCDATQITAVKTLLADQDAVASFIGHVKDSEAQLQTIAIQNVVKVKKESGLKRIVSLTGTGVRFSGDKIGIVDRLLNMSINVIDPDRVQDGKNHVAVLKASDLEWTIIRVLKLQSGPSRPFVLQEHGPTQWYVNRQDVAKAVLQVLEEHSFIQQAPMLSKPVVPKNRPS